MKQTTKTKITVVIFSLLLTLTAFKLPLRIVSADVFDNIGSELDEFAPIYGQAGEPTDLRETIAKIINLALGFLGVVFIILIIWGGYTWMTAGGNEEQVNRAKKIITRAVIGLAIVLASYAITYFITNVLLESTDFFN